MTVQLYLVIHQRLLGVQHLLVEVHLPLLHQVYVVCDDQDAARAGALLSQGPEVYLNRVDRPSNFELSCFTYPHSVRASLFSV